jgi:conjugal transfer pilus assembly protein TraF
MAMFKSFGGIMGKIAFVVLMLLAVVPAITHADRYYTYSDRPGWWNGKDPVVEEKEEPPPVKPPEPQKVEPSKERRIPKLSDYSMQQLWDMYPDDFQQLLEEFHKKAVQTPTENNVKDFITMKDLARRKSVAFSNVHRLVLQKEPRLSLDREDSYLSPARDATFILEQEVKERVLASHDNYALIYFYQDGCPYCETQSNILRFLAEARHWLVKPVNITKNRALALRFNITVTPTILLIKKGEEGYLPLGTGVITLERLDERIYSGMRMMEGETKPEQYGMRGYQAGTPMDPLAPLQQKGGEK